MLKVAELQQLAEERWKDAQILMDAGRYDGVVYLCGYVVELQPRPRICKTLGWQGYPSINKEFEGLTSFKTHRLETLLKLAGIEQRIKKCYFTEWS